MPSSVIRSFRYLPDERALDVTFVTGRRYRYLDVPPEVAEALALASSKGSAFNELIRDRFAFKRLR